MHDLIPAALVLTVSVIAYFQHRPAARIVVPIVAVTALLYLWRLDFSPVYLHYDEVFFGLQANAIRTSLHDVNGRLLPVYFQLDNTANWYQPIAVYWSALALVFAPLS